MVKSVEPALIETIWILFISGDSVARFLTPGFFNDSNPSGLIIHVLKSFRIWVWFRGDARMCKKKLRDVIDTIARLRGVILRSLYDTAESETFLVLTSGNL